MSDTDKVKGRYCSKQEMIFYLNAVEEVKRLREGIEKALVELNTSAIVLAKAARERLKGLVE